MKTRIFLLIVTCFLLITCKKEVSEPSNDINLVVGKNAGLLINTIDTVLIGGYHNPVSLDLDVNNDNIPDFRLTSEIWGSPGLGQHPKSEILCLNSNSSVFGFISIDTNYLHRDTVVSKTGSAVNIYIYNNYSCRRIASKDTVIGVQPLQFKILSIKRGDVLCKEDIFKSDTSILIYDWYGYPYSTENHNDTTIYTYTTFDYTCNSFPSDMISYIGIKIKEASLEKLGWIKISISDKYKITILETAIQR